MTGTNVQTHEQIIRRKLDLLLRTGQLLVESAADTNRIMRNMKRTAAFLGLPEEHLHIYVQFNMLMVNLSDDKHSFSKFQRCEKHGVNMTAISAISKLSWRAIREDYSIEDYERELEEIASRPRNYTPWQVAIGTGFACGGFCIQFGCDWVAFFYAALAAALGFRLRAVLNERGINHYMSIATAAFVSTAIAWATTYCPKAGRRLRCIRFWLAPCSLCRVYPSSTLWTTCSTTTFRWDLHAPSIPSSCWLPCRSVLLSS